MGAKTWMLVYADGDARDALAAHPTIDREASARLAAELFPKHRLEALGDVDLCDTCPRNREIRVGCFPGVSIVAAQEFGIDFPSKLPQRFVAAAGPRTLYLHAMHSVVDWFAFAVWRAGKLERALSLSPDSGILEDIGKRLPFEDPYWTGHHPATDPADEDAYPFPFHPLDLGEAALRACFGYGLEGEIDDSLLDPETIPLARYRRKSRWFGFW